jgi:hypothetical protein
MKHVSVIAFGLLLLAACGASRGAGDARDGIGPEATSDARVADVLSPDPGEPVPEGVDTARDDSGGIDADDSVCPVAVIQIDEGEQVIPQTVLHLHGEGSHSGAGAINSYQWTVEQPAGSISYLVPSGTFPNPIFEANVAGKYVFMLDVVDATGIESCHPARREVFVVPDDAIHAELLWETPADPDPTDEGPVAGTNLDLHLAHPLGVACDADGDGGPDPWFDPHWDCWSGNPNPHWGNPDPSVDDNPDLDRDDADGGGPENVNLVIPEGDPSMPYAYRVAVHYRDDHGFGPSYATLRVYIYSTLAFEVGDVELQPGDLWQVCTVEWPSTKVTLTLNAQGNYDVRPDYPDTPPCP